MMRRRVGLLAPLLGGALFLAACASGSNQPPEVEAIAATWNDLGPQSKQDICGFYSTGQSTYGSTALREAAVERYPDQFLNMDLYDAAYWFFTSHDELGPSDLHLDRGTYYDLTSRQEYSTDTGTDFAPVEDYPSFVGYVEKWPINPCSTE